MGEEIDIIEVQKKTLKEYKSRKSEEEASKNWNKFYKRNGDRFFKDRHWISNEMVELVEDNIQKKLDCTLIEIGCGVGNSVIPLLEQYENLRIFGWDFSSVAIDILKNNLAKLSNNINSRCNLNVVDIRYDISKQINMNFTVDFATLIFVLSSLHPDTLIDAINNIKPFLSKKSLVFVRDYALNDAAQLKFNSSKEIEDNFYLKDDGTRVFYFSTNILETLFKQCGFSTIKCEYKQSRTTNIKKNINIERRFIQAKFILN